MTDQEITDAVTAKLTGKFYVGAQVEVLHSGKRGIINSIRESSPGYSYIRVRFPISGGHWEYPASSLRLL